MPSERVVGANSGRISNNGFDQTQLPRKLPCCVAEAKVSKEHHRTKFSKQLLRWYSIPLFKHSCQECCYAVLVDAIRMCKGAQAQEVCIIQKQVAVGLGPVSASPANLHTTKCSSS